MVKILHKLLNIILCSAIGITPVYAQGMSVWQAGDKAYQYSITHHYTTKHIYVLIDFTRPSTTKRLFIINADTNQIIYSTYVAHGANSGSGIYTTSFSNAYGSKQTSLGVYKTVKYNNGHHGLAIRVQGLESTNNNAYERMIEVHGATYIGSGKSGHSWGCFAIPQNELGTIIPKIGIGTIIIAYYPNQNWLHTSKFLNN